MSGEDSVSPERRLEALEAILDDLADANDAMPILVEGGKDVAALRALGMEGEIVTVNTGVSLVNLVEAFHGEGREGFILLMDWDRTGGRLQRRLRELLEAHGLKWNDRHRQSLVRIVGNEARSVESLSNLHASLMRRAQPGTLPPQDDPQPHG